MVKPDEHELRELLNDWGLLGPDTLVAECWLKFRNDHVLPYAGGWLDQPDWVRQGFNTLDAIEAFHQIQHDKPDPPSRGFFDIFRRGK